MSWPDIRPIKLAWKFLRHGGCRMLPVWSRPLGFVGMNFGRMRNSASSLRSQTLAMELWGSSPPHIAHPRKHIVWQKLYLCVKITCLLQQPYWMSVEQLFYVWWSNGLSSPTQTLTMPCSFVLFHIYHLSSILMSMLISFFFIWF